MNDALETLSRIAHARRGELAAIARREGLTPEDAVDCVQDALCTFLRLAQKGELPAEDVALGAFLGGVVRNVARNARRLHRLARPHDALDAVDHPGASPATADDASSESLVARAEDHVRLRACVDRLCETQKAVVTLRLLEERRGDDVAEALGITRAHVDVLLHRAKASLRVCMTHGE
jgi:RNA polymerase sigma-70 factor (ECF subfamily)